MKQTNTAAKRLSVFFLVLLLSIGGGWFWWLNGIAPVSVTDSTPVLFVVAKGEGARSIATKLSQQGLIRSPTVFFLLVKVMGIERNLQAGDFRLFRSMSARQIASELTHGFLDVWVTTLEGWRVEEIANRLAKDLDIPESEFLKVAREGYMFPDTYLIPRDASAAAIAEIFLNTFNEKFTENMRQDATQVGLTFHEVVTLASIVEREGKTADDRQVIAGILLKRLKAGWPLQTDATLQYILGYQPMEKSWWKKGITAADKAVRSPYNTYTNTGLPPDPIASPGLNAITAVIYPKETEFWYYLHDPSGTVHYARTLEEHNANIVTYLQ